jgi:mRNA interferase MazF
VTVPFVGAVETKRRPAIVVSSDVYHANRPDIIVAVLTTNVAAAKGPTDYVLQDWRAPGLRNPSAFRVYLNMVMPFEARLIGHLSDRDWQAVRQCLQRAIG